MSTLPTRRLGTQGPEITRVGFGSWAVGGGDWLYGWGPQDDAESIDALRRALERGVDWIDTAAVYGLGHSEEVVGRLLRELPAGRRPLVFTKCGQVWDESDRMAPTRQVLEPASIRRECDSSLRRLGVERIDLYQFHWPDAFGTPVEDSWGEMARLVEEGKVRWAGVCNFTVQLLERCERIRHVDSYQPPFSLVRREVGAEQIPWCAANGTGVIVYSPMQAGLLTGRWSLERREQLPAGDWRRRSPEFHSPRLERSLALAESLRPIAERRGVGIGAVAIAWTLAWPGVTAAIVGARSAAQVDGWIPAAGLTLSAEEIEEIAGSVERTGAGSGPARPPAPAARG
jgi:aryl-alcohol dehydrogenase-like predicted oxidoreductase